MLTCSGIHRSTHAHSGIWTRTYTDLECCMSSKVGIDCWCKSRFVQVATYMLSARGLVVRGPLLISTARGLSTDHICNTAGTGTEPVGSLLSSSKKRLAVLRVRSHSHVQNTGMLEGCAVLPWSAWWQCTHVHGHSANVACKSTKSQAKLLNNNRVDHDCAVCCVTVLSQSTVHCVGHCRFEQMRHDSPTLRLSPGFSPAQSG